MNVAYKVDMDIRWEQNEDHFRLWTEGRTGYPLGG